MESAGGIGVGGGVGGGGGGDCAAFREQPLWGGALSASLPAGLVDASRLRPVPDAQEAWLQPHGDGCIIAEIIEFEAEGEAGAGAEGEAGAEAEADADADADAKVASSAVDAAVAAAHWRVLAEEAGCGASADGALSALDARGAQPAAVHVRGARAVTVSGVLRAAKYNEGEAARNAIALHLVLVRLPPATSASADLLFAVHAPLAVSAASSSFRHGEAGCTPADAALVAAGVSAAAVAAARPPAAREFAPGLPADAVLARIADSLRVHNWGLFTPPPA